MLHPFASGSAHPRWLLGAKIVLVLVLSTLMLTSLAQETSSDQTPASQQWSMGYWTAFAPDPIADLEWGALTHVAFVGVEPRTNGSLNYSDANFSADALDMIATAHAHDVKVLLDVWAGPGDFNGAILTNLAGFVSNIMSVVDTYGFDGVDLDWESHFNPSNNTPLLSALRMQLGKKLLTQEAALGGPVRYWGFAQQYLDRVNVLSYDLGGTFNRYSWFNSPLHSSDARMWSWDLARFRFTKAAIPPDKLDMGIPFFGQIFSGGTPSITGPHQAWGPVLPTVGEIKYTSLIHNYDISNPNRDGIAMVPWISYGDGWISFEDAASIAAKIGYVQSNKLGGWIIWALDQDYFPNQDPKHPLLTAIKNAMVAQHAP